MVSEFGTNRLMNKQGRNDLKVKDRKIYDAPTRGFAMVLVDSILSRGNAAQMRNIAGEFKVTELVLN